jgi:ring-1,2-phenylacetyl-CoA epoxidase subunit PaaD
VVSVPQHDLDRARRVAATVVDPELPMLSLDDLGVLRDVAEEDGRVVVTVTPTHLGCPAFSMIKTDLARALAAAGFGDVEVRTALSPAWSTDWISDRGRNALAEHGVGPPAPAGAVTLRLMVRAVAECPRCGAPAEQLSAYGAAPCLSLQRCTACGEPFEAMKPV